MAFYGKLLFMSAHKVAGQNRACNYWWTGEGVGEGTFWV